MGTNNTPERTGLRDMSEVGGNKQLSSPIRPCPFCKKWMCRIRDFGFVGGPGCWKSAYCVQCYNDNCGVVGPVSTDPNEAISNWNDASAFQAPVPSVGAIDWEKLAEVRELINSAIAADDGHSADELGQADNLLDQIFASRPTTPASAVQPAVRESFWNWMPEDGDVDALVKRMMTDEAYCRASVIEAVSMINRFDQLEAAAHTQHTTALEAENAKLNSVLDEILALNGGENCSWAHDLIMAHRQALASRKDNADTVGVKESENCKPTGQITTG